MTGSALSLYLEETKVNEDCMFPTEISPIKREDIPESKIQSNLTLLAGARDNPPQARKEPCDVLFATTLALHKVLLFRNLVHKQENCCVCSYRVITKITLSLQERDGIKEKFQIKSSMKLVFLDNTTVPTWQYLSGFSRLFYPKVTLYSCLTSSG